MRDFHYIEVKHEGELIARFKTTQFDFAKDWNRLSLEYIQYDVHYTTSSEPEKVFNRIPKLTGYEN